MWMGDAGWVRPKSNGPNRNQIWRVQQLGSKIPLFLIQPNLNLTKLKIGDRGPQILDPLGSIWLLVRPIGFRPNLSYINGTLTFLGFNTQRWLVGNHFLSKNRLFDGLLWIFTFNPSLLVCFIRRDCFETLRIEFLSNKWALGQMVLALLIDRDCVGLWAIRNWLHWSPNLIKLDHQDSMLVKRKSHSSYILQWDC